MHMHVDVDDILFLWSQNGRGQNWDQSIEPRFDYKPRQVKYQLNPTQKLIKEYRASGLYWNRYGIP